MLRRKIDIRLSWGIMASLCGWAGSIAHANAPVTWLNAERGLPICIQTPQSNLYLNWNKHDLYTRTIWVLRTQTDCDKDMIKAAAFSPDGWVSESTDPLPGDLPPDLLLRLEEVRRGATEYHPEPTGVAYLARHPMKEFTLETNRDLTARYGKGFSGEVYRAWIEHQPKNKRFREKFLGEAAAFRARPETERLSLGKRAGKIKALVLMGLGWDFNVTDKTADYIRNFVTEILKNEAMATSDDNIAMVQPQIDAHLKAGEDLIFFTLCKGSLEAYSALGRILEPYMEESRTQAHLPPGYGRVIGIINLSGMLRGTYLSDLDAKIPGAGVLAKLASWIPTELTIKMGRYQHAMASMAPAHVQALHDEFVHNLPSDTVYVNVVGIEPGNGLIANDSLTMLPFYKVDERFHGAKGANDGFIEYPGNEFPDSMSRQVYTVAFDSTHILTDGSVGQFDLTHEHSRERIAVYQALYSRVLDESLFLRKAK